MIRSLTRSSGHRGLHCAGPGSCLFLLMSLVLAALAGDSLLLSAGCLALVILLTAWSTDSALAWGRSFRFVVMFAGLLFVAQTLSLREGIVLFRVGIPITTGGLAAGAHMALRFGLILSASYLFVLVTDPDTLAGLLIRWGIPYRYGFTLILAMRFVPFFRSELRTVREAQQMRGIRVSVRSLSGIRRAISYTFVPVLVSGLIRVDTIAMSMKGRAFGLHRRRTAAPRAPLRREGLVAVGCGGLIVALVALARSFAWP